MAEHYPQAPILEAVIAAAHALHQFFAVAPGAACAPPPANAVIIATNCCACSGVQWFSAQARSAARWTIPDIICLIIGCWRSRISWVIAGIFFWIDCPSGLMVQASNERS